MTADVLLLRCDVDAAAYQRLRTVLSTEERVRSNGYHFDADKRRFVVAHAALRLLIARRLRQPSRLIEFVEGPAGKPALSSSALHFNIAHSGDLVALAFADTDVGVDIEQRSAPIDAVALAESVFAHQEIERVRRASDPVDAFLRIWTAKEAVVKACGGGLSIPLDQFVVPNLTQELRAIRAPGVGQHQGGWFVGQLCCPPSYYGAVSARGTIDVTRCDLDVADLLHDQEH